MAQLIRKVDQRYHQRLQHQLHFSEDLFDCNNQSAVLYADDIEPGGF
jgi:hypothetical protein